MRVALPRRQYSDQDLGTLNVVDTLMGEAALLHDAVSHAGAGAVGGVEQVIRATLA